MQGGKVMGEESVNARRAFLRGSTVIGTGLILTACGSKVPSEQAEQHPPAKKDEDKKGGEVTATEDLMREHGVLRRALLVYTAAATKLRRDPSTVAPDALQRTAKLF